MNRRNFLAAAGAAAALSGAGAASAQDQTAGAGNTFYEFRKYFTLPGDAKKVLENYLRKAAIPAWGRLGIGPVGAFTVQYGLNSPPAIYVLLPHPTLESIVSSTAKLMADEEYLKAAEPFLNAPPEAPAFFRIESTLLRAFNGAPKIEQPAPSKEKKKSRIFELRIYESSNPVFARQKIKMFNEGGEIGIFKKTGMNPVLFAETIAGPLMPNLHYMLCFENLEEHDKAWETFRNDPDWKKLSADPQYKNAVSNISDIIFKPTGYSQL